MIGGSERTLQRRLSGSLALPTADVGDLRYARPPTAVADAP